MLKLLNHADDYKIGDVLRGISGSLTGKCLTIVELASGDLGPKVQWEFDNSPNHFVKNWAWKSFGRIEPDTFVVGKKYVPAQTVARGVITILAQLDDGDFAFSFEDFKTSQIIVNKAHPSAFVHYKEYVEPPPEEWRALYWLEHGKPEVSAAFYDSEKDTIDCESKKEGFMYAIRTDKGALWKNKK